MSFWSNIRRRYKLLKFVFSQSFASVTSTLTDPEAWLLDALGISNAESDSGVKVTDKTALSYAPFWYGVCRIAGHLGLSPMNLVRVSGDDIEVMTTATHPQAGFFGELGQVNDFLSGDVAKECAQSHVLTRGNGRLAITSRDSNGAPTELALIVPSQVEMVVVYDEEIGATFKIHRVTVQDGTRHHLFDREVMHIKGLGYDGIQGYSLIQYARNSLGSGLGGEAQFNYTMRNRSRPSLILQAPEGVYEDDQEAKAFLDDFNRNHMSISNAQRAALLRNGVTATTVSVPADDQQLLQQRQFSREEVSLWLGLEHMPGSKEGSAYNSVSQRMGAYYVNALVRWVVRWETEASLKLLTAAQRKRGLLYRYDLSQILRGSTLERLQQYEIGERIGLYSQQDLRRFERMTPPPEDEDFRGSSPPQVPQQPPMPGPGEEGGGDGQEPSRTNGASSRPPSPGLAQSNSRAERFVERELSRQFIHERRDLLSLIAKPGRFVDNLEGYYNSRRSQVDGILGRLEAPPDFTDAWISESFETVLEATGNATNLDELRLEISRETGRWSTDRAIVLATKITRSWDDDTVAADGERGFLPSANGRHHRFAAGVETGP